jgi:hypothetical protein
MLEEEAGELTWLTFLGMVWPKPLHEESSRREGDKLLGEFPTEAAEEIPESKSSF